MKQNKNKQTKSWGTKGICIFNMLTILLYSEVPNS